mmetsp:Transcript_55053/g.144805  ORF Transcript_55053/g.144805 Transcript_55053/m.144805 type:complete len:115 (-) Transcript_55053:92-436(-)
MSARAFSGVRAHILANSSQEEDLPSSRGSTPSNIGSVSFFMGPLIGLPCLETEDRLLDFSEDRPQGLHARMPSRTYTPLILGGLGDVQRASSFRGGAPAGPCGRPAELRFEYAD